MSGKRYWFIVGAFVVVTLAMLGRMLVLATYDREFLQDWGNSRAHRDIGVPTMRGVIYDRAGQLLAMSTPVQSIWTDPGMDTIPEESYPELATALQIKESELERIVVSGEGKRFLYLKKRVSHSISQAVARLGIEGIRFETEYRRYYPAAEVTAHVVGLIKNDGSGIEGLELSHDRSLQGSEGKRRVLRARDGRRLRDVRLIEPPRFGEDATLTIDLGLQFLSYQKLRNAVAEHQAESATLILIDVLNGEILALANYPSYNPNDGNDRVFSRMRNRAIADTYEPGSTIKPFTALAALESGTYRRDTVIDTSPGTFRIGRHTVEDPRDYGELTLEGVLTKSSQVGISKIALDLETYALYSTLSRAGFTDIPHSGLPNESLGHVNIDDLEREIGRATMAYGYGLRVSPLQLATGYLTLATGGVRRTPNILLGRNASLNSEERVFDETHTKTIVDMLQGVVSPIGTAPKANMEGFAVSGKTGTVRKISDGQYDDTRHIAWFVGMVPASDPRILAVIVVDEPKGETVSGGGVAAPVFAEIASHALQLIGLSSSGSTPTGDEDAA